MSERPFKHLSGEELRRQSKRADDKLGAELDRIRISDPHFRDALDRALALESEAEARRNR